MVYNPNEDFKQHKFDEKRANQFLRRKPHIKFRSSLFKGLRVRTEPAVFNA